MSNNNNNNNNRRRTTPRPFPFNTQPLANDPIWREYGYSMPNNNNFQLAQSYPATPVREETQEYEIPQSPPQLLRRNPFLRNRSASINSTATTNPEPISFADRLESIPENNNQSVNMLPENESGFQNSFSLSTNEENYSENENPKPRKRVRITGNNTSRGGKRKTRRRAHRKRKTHRKH